MGSKGLFMRSRNLVAVFRDLTSRDSFVNSKDLLVIFASTNRININNRLLLRIWRRGLWLIYSLGLLSLLLYHSGWAWVHLLSICLVLARPSSTPSLAPFWEDVLVGGTSLPPVRSLVRGSPGIGGDGWCCRQKDWTQRTRGKRVALMEGEDDRDEILTPL
jgi:hypothetical protein